MCSGAPLPQPLCSLALFSLNIQGVEGSILQMISHGIVSSALFFLVGMLYERRGSRLFDDYGGVASVMPWFAVMLIIATLGSVGLPGTGGFVGEFLTLVGVFKSSVVAAVCASLGVLLGAVYMLSFCRRVLFGKTKETNSSIKDLSFIEFVYITPLAFLIVVMGVFPNIFLDRIRPSVEYLGSTYKTYKLSVQYDEGNKKQKFASYVQKINRKLP